MLSLILILLRVIHKRIIVQNIGTTNNTSESPAVPRKAVRRMFTNSRERWR